MSYVGEASASAVVFVRPKDIPAASVTILKGGWPYSVARFGSYDAVVGDTATDVLQVIVPDPSYPDTPSYVIQIRDPHVQCSDGGQWGWRLDLTTWLQSSFTVWARGQVCAMFNGNVQTQSQLTLYQDKLVFSRNDAGARQAAAVTVYYRDIYGEQPSAASNVDLALTSPALSSFKPLPMVTGAVGEEVSPKFADELNKEVKTKYFNDSTANTFQLTLCPYLGMQVLCDSKGQRFSSTSTIAADDLVGVSKFLGAAFPVPFLQALFVVDSGQHLFAIKARDMFFPWFNQERSDVRHSSFTRGAPVMMAGHIICINGFIVLVTNQSGHYRPACVRMKNYMPAYLKKIGYTGDKIKPIQYTCID